LIYLVSSGNGSDTPVSVLRDHTFGIRCVAFSPDGRWLCSIGDLHDGSVFLWSVNSRTGAAKLYASSRCNSVVHDLAWLDNTGFVTVGIRHVKLWRVDQIAPNSPSKGRFSRTENAEFSPPNSSTKLLPGRNCLLGSLLDANFTCITPVGERKALIGTDRGELCVVDYSENAQRLYHASSFEFGIRCIAVNQITGKAWVAGSRMSISSVLLSSLEASPDSSLTRQPRRGSTVSTDSRTSSSDVNVIALGVVRDNLVAIDSKHQIRMLQAGDEQDVDLERNFHQINCHSSSVMGVILETDSETSENSMKFSTFASNGEVLSWIGTGHLTSSRTIQLDQPRTEPGEELNELKVLKRAPCGKFFVSGDSLGILRYATKSKMHDNGLITS
jgi:WD40 repeat protein